MPLLMTIAKRAALAKVAPAPAPVVPTPTPTPSPFLSFSGSVEPAIQSTSVVEIPVVEEPAVEKDSTE